MKKRGLNQNVARGIAAYRTGQQLGKTGQQNPEGEIESNSLENLAGGARKVVGETKKAIKNVRGVIRENVAKKAARSKPDNKEGKNTKGGKQGADTKSKRMVQANKKARSLNKKTSAVKSNADKASSKAGAGAKGGSKAAGKQAAAKAQVAQRAQVAMKQKMIAAKATKTAVKTSAKVAVKAAATTAQVAAKTAALSSNPVGWIIIIVAVVVIIIVVIVFAAQLGTMGVAAVAQQQQAMGYGGTFAFPLHNHDKHNCNFTDTFGDDRDGGARGHQATDIGAAEGEPIYAMVNGTVATNRWNGQANPGGTGGGWEISIKDEQGYIYKCLHMMKQSTLPVGTEVIAGVTVLGYVGHTGANITANHLHITLYDPSGAKANPYETLRRSHDNPLGDTSGNLPADGNKPAILNSVVTKPPGVSEPVAVLTGYRITYYSGGEGETVDRYGNKLVIGTAAKWMGLGNNAYPAGILDGTIFSIGEGAEERFYKVTDVGGFGNVPTEVKKKTFDLFAGENVAASELTSSQYGTQTGVTIKVWRWGN